MKKLFMLGFLAGAIMISQVIFTDAPQIGSAPEPDKVTQVLPASSIDGIDVPYEVLMDIQTEFQGYAVTHANKESRNGGTIYRLRVERDGNPNDSDNFYLLFDADWQLLGKEKSAAPQPKQNQVREEDKKEKPQQDDGQEGGRGGPSEPEEPAVQIPEEPGDEKPPVEDPPTDPVPED